MPSHEGPDWILQASGVAQVQNFRLSLSDSSVIRAECASRRVPRSRFRKALSFRAF
jgi:hypothetical protein